MIFQDTYDEILLQWFIIKQMMAPLRLTRWQLAKLFAAEINREYPIAAKLFVLSIAGLLYWTLYGFIQPRKTAQPRELPVLRFSRSSKGDIRDLLEEGKERYSHTPYIADTSKTQFVVYPPTAFDEIKRLTQQEASVQDFFQAITSGFVGIETDELRSTIAVDLTRSIPLKIPSQQKDARSAFDKNVGYCPDYKPMPLFSTIVKIIASVNASSFLGRDVGMGIWPDIISQLPFTVSTALVAYSWVPGLLKPIIRPIFFLYGLKTQRDIKNLIKLAVYRDMEGYARAADRKELLRPALDGKLPFTQWLMARYKPSKATLSQLVTDQLLVNVEGTIKSATSLYGIVFELAKRPDLQDELRREVQEVTINGRLPSTNLKELRRMDSVMRESARVNPFSLFTLCRKTRRPLQLSLGPMLPTGTILCVDSYHINNSSTLFAEPHHFDPSRFLHKRSKTSTEQCYQYVSTGPSDPNWGDGTQVCPGRFFTNSVLKVCLAHLLLNYNFRLGTSQEKLEMTSMPNGIFAPNLAAHVLFQSRN